MPSSQSKKIKVASIQMPQNISPFSEYLNPYLDNFSLEKAIQSTLDRLEIYKKKFIEAGEKKVDLIVGIEDMSGLSLYSSYMDDPDIFKSLVLATQDLYSECISDIAKTYKMHIVACYPTIIDGDIYNCGILFNDEGNVLGKYKKVHLPPTESWMMKSGTNYPVFETKIGKIAILICYDCKWPEAAACCSLNGAEIICHPTLATPLDFQTQTRANDNQVHYITSSRNNSLIVSPNGQILAKGKEDSSETIYAEIQIEGSSLDSKNSYSTLYSGIQNIKQRQEFHRRPETYTALIKPINNKEILEKNPLAYRYQDQDIMKIYNIHKKEILKESNHEETKYKW